MAIIIKNIPVLKDSAARRFDEAAKASAKKRATIEFSKQIAISSKILEKADI